MDAIDRLTINGYKSIRSLENFEMRRLNVLIGANGAGKSNFVGFFRLMRSLVEQRLQLALAVEGGADVCLHRGPKAVARLAARIDFGESEYAFSLVPATGDRLAFSSELAINNGVGQDLGSGHFEAHLKDCADRRGAQLAPAHPAYESISNWVVYHFHDTTSLASVRRQRAINDSEYLREDAANLAAFLYRIRHASRDTYDHIRDVVRMIAPFFDDFKLCPVPNTPDLIQLEWLQKGSGRPFDPNQMSDGTLRFVCLATALLQPSRPATILFDEPEIGLHPHALAILGALFHKAAYDKQLVISTQSASLLNEIEPDDIVVVERANGESFFHRLSAASVSEWLREYSIGELWEKNVLGGDPHDDRFFEPVSEAAGEQ